MKEKVYLIGMGEYKIASNPTTLVSSGIGSCVVICLYDRTKKIGGMAHAMLPQTPEDYKIDDDEEDGARYVDRAVQLLVSNMKSLGCDSSNMMAKIAGGANMFSTLGTYSREIGENNVEMTKKILAEMGIKLVAESTGGTTGRSV